MVQKHTNPIVQNHIKDLWSLFGVIHVFYILAIVLSPTPNLESYLYMIIILFTYNTCNTLIYVYQTQIKKKKYTFIILNILMMFEMLFTILDIILYYLHKSLFNANISILFKTLVFQILLYLAIRINFNGIKKFQYRIDIEQNLL